jgi:hypothetical protein
MKQQLRRSAILIANAGVAPFPRRQWFPTPPTNSAGGSSKREIHRGARAPQLTFAGRR